uniref:Bromo domain-containing protein n=1 Tax=Musa acuminata subsp. malaccensis TaxID=214687 RepID=A0A804L2Z8_MUSAM|nr:PREDICTED: bromodomain-containing protein DDB_G0270170-like isoform X1 [Musa acuminata subsp. malaccensis]
MGNSSRAAVDASKRKRRKKGRPSLLDLQKRSLRLQNQQQNNLSPNPNPSPKFPQSNTPSASRRVTRRNPNPSQDDPPRPPPEAGRDEEEEEEEEDGGSGGKRREKKLKLVLRLPSRSAGSGSESDGAANADPKRRKIGHENRVKKAECNNSPKATGLVPGELPDLGPTTPLPDKKLLAFILDRLQKKDTYGVFSEPVDPEELPDYHEVIEHPMDFGTVRNKLLTGAYFNLEQFENDVFLISSNAMRYNAPDTIYFRQARSIHELAKKNFENLRQEGNDNEPEPKTVVRRGRPPNKHKKVGRPPADRAASDFSTDVTLANAGDTNHLSNLAHDSLRKGSSGEKSGVANASNRALYGLRCTDTCGWISEQKADRDEEYSGSAPKGNHTKYGKKLIVVDENRRNTYKQSLASTYTHETPIFTILNGEKKQLMPVGLHLEYAYARSLARFAAKLGPIGWLLTAPKIQRVLPPGTKFGPGWVADGEAPQHSQPLVPSISPPHPLAKSCASSTIDKHSHGQEMPHNDVIVKEGHINRTTVPASTLAVSSNVSSFPGDPSLSRVPSHENGSSSLINGGVDGDAIRPKVPFQHHQNPGMHPTIDGLSGSFNSNMVSQLGNMIRPAGMLYGPFGSDAQMSHARALDMVSRANNNYIHQTAERPTVVDNSSTKNSGKPLKEAGNDSKGPWQSTTLQRKSDSAPPDLNVGFQSPGSPASDMVVGSQQPDLALQL